MATYYDGSALNDAPIDWVVRVWDGLLLAGRAGMLLAALITVLALLVCLRYRLIALMLGLCGLLMWAGVIYHHWRLHDAGMQFPAPGTMVDVGGFKLHLLAEGEPNGPTVVWVPGGHGQGLFLYHLHREMAARTRSIIFDRAGSGWSEQGPLPRHTLREIDELHHALEKLGEKGPFVFVGHSFGGLFSVNFAQRYTQEVAGVVLLDPTTPEFLTYFSNLMIKPWLKSARVQALKANFGLAWNRQETEQERQWYSVLEPVNAARLSREFLPGGILLDPLAVMDTGKRAMGLAQGDGVLGEIPLLTILANEDAAIRDAELNDLFADRGLSTIERVNAMQLMGAEAKRLEALSNNSTLMYAPEGASHLFPYEFPEFVLQQLMRFTSEVSYGSSN